MASLPDGFEMLRPHQEVAIKEIIDHFESDIDVVFLDAPTGSGKTLIGEMVRREMDVSTLYVCSDKSLQDQFARDFPYAKVLKGRSNYPTQSNPQATAADCTASGRDDPCWHCAGGKPECPYEIAKLEARMSPLAVTNTSYLLTEANYVGGFSGRELVIADEGDTLEQIMMGFVEYRAPKRLIELCGMTAPIKGARKTTLVKWLEDFSNELVVQLAKVNRRADPKKYRALDSAKQNARRMAHELEKDIEKRQSDADDSGVWLRDYPSDRELKRDDYDGLILKPVVVSGHGIRNLWRHGQKWLVMSATIVSADEMADSLGLPLDYATVTVPMTFPVENRPVVLAPVANVTYKEMDKAVLDLAHAIRVACEKHPDDRVLIHTVSYGLASKLEKELKFGKDRLTNRTIVTYSEGRNREAALLKYRRTEGAVMLAPSMTRGIDMVDDACRVQIIAKCPFPALGDKQVNSRVHLPGGQMWYTVKTIRDIVQMTGRAVRHDDDWAVTYVFDSQFTRNLWRQWKRLFPEWWREAVVTNQDVREFIRR